MYRALSQVARRLRRVVGGSTTTRPPRAAGRLNAAGITLIEVLLIILAVLVLAILIVLLLWWLLDDDDDDPSVVGPSGAGDPPVAALEIVPDSVTLLEGSQIQLYARPKDSDGYVIRECDCLIIDWKADPGVPWVSFRERASPHRRLLRAEDAGGVDPPTITVTAKVGSVQATAKVVIVRGAALSGDLLKADAHGGAPEAALVTGNSGKVASYMVDEPVAFAGVGPLGEMDNGTTNQKPSQVALFSSRHEMGFTGDATREGFSWPTPGNTELVESSVAAVTGTVLRALPEMPLNLKVHLWIATSELAGSPRHAFSIAEGDLGLANDIFRANRVGIELVRTGPTLIKIPKPPGIPAADPCSPGKFRDYLDTLSSSPKPDLKDGSIINVLYLDEPGTHDKKGYRCGTSAGQSGLIMIYLRGFTSTTLVHELGHELGLRDPLPFKGHIGNWSQRVSGLDHNNVMAMHVSSYPFLRDHLTLGQVFRMVADSLSFVNRDVDQGTQLTLREMATAADGKARPARRCGGDPSNEDECPKLCVDVQPPVIPGPTAQSCTQVSW